MNHWKNCPWYLLPFVFVYAIVLRVPIAYACRALDWLFVKTGAAYVWDYLLDVAIPMRLQWRAEHARLAREWKQRLDFDCACRECQLHASRRRSE